MDCCIQSGPAGVDIEMVWWFVEQAGHGAYPQTSAQTTAALFSPPESLEITVSARIFEKTKTSEMATEV